MSESSRERRRSDRRLDGHHSGRSGAPCESPQAGISAAGGRDSVLRRPAAGILNLLKHRDTPASNAEGKGWSIQRRGLQAGRSDAGLDQVQKDPSNLGGIGDDGKHFHGGAAKAAVKGVYLVDLGQQPRPCRTRFPGGDGGLGTILEDRLQRRGRLLRVLLHPSLGRFAPLGGQAHQPRLARPRPAGRRLPPFASQSAAGRGKSTTRSGAPGGCARRAGASGVGRGTPRREQPRVGLEVGIVLRAVQDTSLVPPAACADTAPRCPAAGILCLLKDMDRPRARQRKGLVNSAQKLQGREGQGRS